MGMVTIVKGEKTLTVTETIRKVLKNNEYKICELANIGLQPQTASCFNICLENARGKCLLAVNNINSAVSVLCLTSFMDETETISGCLPCGFLTSRSLGYWQVSHELRLVWNHVCLTNSTAKVYSTF